MQEIKLIITGMKCQGCVKSVKTALESLPGIQIIDIDLSSGRAIIQGEISSQTLIDTIHKKTPYKAHLESENPSS